MTERFMWKPGDVTLETECRIIGPYLLVGDTDWMCETHHVNAVLRDLGRFGASDLRRADFRCPQEGT